MTLEIKHATQVDSGVWPDDPSVPIGTNEWNAVLTATMLTARLLGRVTASTGAVEELTAAQVRTMLALVAVATSGSAEDLTEGSTKKLLTTAERTKVGHLTITQAVDLDAIETRVNALDAAVILKGAWSAAGGTFPGSGAAQAGESWIVSTGGSVGGIAFNQNDRIIAIVDNASTSTFANNWFKADYTDQVLTVAGKTGTVTLQVADITDMSANGRSLVSAADYAAMRTLLGLVPGTDIQAYDVDTAKTDVDQTWTGAQKSGTGTTLTSGTTITPTLANWEGNRASLTLGHNAVLADPSDIASMVGYVGRIVGQQDATGGRTLSYGSSWFPRGAAAAPALPAGANAKFRIDFEVVASGRIDFTASGVGV